MFVTEEFGGAAALNMVITRVKEDPASASFEETVCGGNRPGKADSHLALHVRFVLVCSPIQRYTY